MHTLQSLLLLALGAAALPNPRPALLPRQDSDESGDDYSLVEVGARNTVDWRLWLTKNGEPASFWHDVPTYPDASNDTIINFIVEIPRWTNGKIEIKRDEPLNPIFHDTNDDDTVRFVDNVWPHRSYPFLYGSIPRTWESPNFNHSFTGVPGDNDPMDAFDIGQAVGSVGQIKQVKVLGGLALNDGGETDWKMLVIDVDDPIAPLVNDWQDVETYRPGIARAYLEWFHTYKIPRGDGYLPIIGELYQNASYSARQIAESHGFWRDLVTGDVDPNEINYNQTSSSEFAASYIPAEDANDELDIPRESAVEPAVDDLPEEATVWAYLDANYEFVEQEAEGGDGDDDDQED